MIIEQIFVANSLRNFNYIIACNETKEAIVIDPLDVDKITAIAKKNNYKITKIINTHEHADHTDGNVALINATNAVVYCHNSALQTIPMASCGLKAGDTINLGSLKLEMLDTPGHTFSHLCILVYRDNKPVAIFSGDTLFNAGVGNCYSGNMDDLYNSFDNILFKLPDEVLVYPGHDYLENNLRFTLSVEHDNQYAQDLLAKLHELNSNQFFITTMAIERQINTFFRLNENSVINNLAELKNKQIITDKDVFVALRKLRNSW